MKTKFTWAHWAQWFSLIAAIGLFLGVFPILAYRGRLDAFTSITAQGVIDVLKIMASWPVAVALIAFRFMSRFHDALNTYLSNIRLVKLPGGIQLESPQNPLAAESGTRDSLTLSAADLDRLKEGISELERAYNLSVDQKDAIKKRLDLISETANQWKFRYFNEFFVERTKFVLYWFSMAPPQSRASFHAHWARLNVDEQQRTIILNLLMQSGFVTEVGGVLRITQHGHSFLQFIGFIPPIPSTG
ncbi:hypothetical protein DCC62_18690 [candidate division KSB1 bacterium]|nr:MAG: hypothetical protein DCC62_18690 [candidate division KSB1 bacterium]